jgi:hypothetical protein
MSFRILKNSDSLSHKPDTPATPAASDFEDDQLEQEPRTNEQSSSTSTPLLNEDPFGTNASRVLFEAIGQSAYGRTKV